MTDPIMQEYKKMLEQEPVLSEAEINTRIQHFADHSASVEILSEKPDEYDYGAHIESLYEDKDYKSICKKKKILTNAIKFINYSSFSSEPRIIEASLSEILIMHSKTKSTMAFYPDEHKPFKTSISAKNFIQWIKEGELQTSEVRLKFKENKCLDEGNVFEKLINGSEAIYFPAGEINSALVVDKQFDLLALLSNYANMGLDYPEVKLHLLMRYDNYQKNGRISCKPEINCIKVEY